MIDDEALEKLIQENKDQDMHFVEYFKHKFTYRFTGVDGVNYSIWCGDTEGDIYRDGWSATEKVGCLRVNECVHFALAKDT